MSTSKVGFSPKVKIPKAKIPKPVYVKTKRGIELLVTDNSKFCNDKLIPSILEQKQIKEIVTELQQSYGYKLVSYDTIRKQFENEYLKKGLVDVVEQTEDLGSLLDYRMLVCDPDNNIILINVNTINKHYKRLCFKTNDKQGRTGYFLIPERDAYLEPLLGTILNLEREGKYNNEEDTWETYYNKPIKQIMKSMGMNVHYGV